LYIHTQNKNNLLEKKVQFLARVKDKIGDQKIDLLLSKDTSRAIEQEAIEKGIKL
jgi:molybdopterin converting factor small subunit